MKRLLLIVLVAVMLVFAGCVDGTGTEADEPTVETDDDLEETDPNGAEDDTTTDEDETDPEETDGSEVDELDSGDDPTGELSPRYRCNPTTYAPTSKCEA